MSTSRACRRTRASTLRTTLAYTTGDYHGFVAMWQFEDVRLVGNEYYDSTINGLAQYPVVADPAGTELDQAYLSYRGLGGSTLKLGRQAIVYDNQRFVGNVGWRQNEQTFDAMTAVVTALPSTTISCAHVANVDRIFGERHPTLSDVKLKADWLNVVYKGLSFGSAGVYAYFNDYEPGQPLAVTESNKTLGVRFDVGTAVSAGKLLYTLEYAKQDDYKDGLSSVDANYQLAMVGMDIGGVQLKLSTELLGGDGSYALQTPFATLHAFNGWADKFLTTPTNGLRDTFLSLGGTVAGTGVLAVYHRYSSDHLDYSYGSELNLQATRKIDAKWSVPAKYAAYRGDPNATNVAASPALAADARKAWLQAELKF